MESKLKINQLGNKIWKLPNGDVHRENGPAIVTNNDNKYWYINGKRHREDGPAVEYSDERKLWFLNDIEYSEQEYMKKMRLIKLEHIL